MTDMPRLSSPAAERAVIAGIMLNDYIPDLEPEDFDDVSCRYVFEAARKVEYTNKSMPIIAHQMFKDGTLDLVGGEPWLTETVGEEWAGAGTPEVMDAAAAVLKDYTRRREDYAKAQELVADAVPAPRAPPKPPQRPKRDYSGEMPR